MAALCQPNNQAYLRYQQISKGRPNICSAANLVDYELGKRFYGRRPERNHLCENHRLAATANLSLARLAKKKKKDLVKKYVPHL